MKRSSLWVAGALASLLVLRVGGQALANDIASPGASGLDARSLYLRAGTIDLRKRPSALTADATFSPDHPYVLQLDGPITPRRRSRLEAAGVRLGDYLPMYAYIADLAEVKATALIDLGFVTWVGPYQEDWKVCPNVVTKKNYRTRRRRELAASGRRRLVVHLFPSVGIHAASRCLRRCGVRPVNLQAARGQYRAEIDIHEQDIESLRSVDEIMFIEEAPEGAPRNETTTWICQSNIQNHTPLWAAGLHGEGQIAGLIDWDLDATHCAFSDTNPIGPAHRKIVAYYGMGQSPGYGWHGTHVGGVLAGDEPTDTDPNLKSMAFASRIVFQHYSAVINAINLNTRLTIAHDDGARIHSNSWGSYSDNSYNAWARDVDLFSRNHEDDLVIFAIMNGALSSPPGSLLSPENAKNCLAVGASQDTPNQGLHGSGAQGPTTDGRQKPDVWVPGCTVSSAMDQSGCSTWTQSCATSWAAPAASGMAVLVRQYFTDGFYPSGVATPSDAFVPSGALLKAVMINSAVDMEGFAGYFGTHEGWGRILLDDALHFAGDHRKLQVQDVRNEEGLSTGEVDTYYVRVDDAGEPLKVTLVWTDVPATVSAAFAPVNNLDLVVTDPGGVVYLGNVFSGSESVTGGSADFLNNVEQVHRTAPVRGVWRVDVVATAVNQDVQGYALVITRGPAWEPRPVHYLTQPDRFSRKTAADFRPRGLSYARWALPDGRQAPNLYDRPRGPRPAALRGCRPLPGQIGQFEYTKGDLNGSRRGNGEEWRIVNGE